MMTSSEGPLFRFALGPQPQVHCIYLPGIDSVLKAFVCLLGL